MKKIIVLVLMVFFVQLVCGELEKQYQIEIIYDQGELKAGKIEVIPTTEEIYWKEKGDYKIELVSFDKEILEENYFDIILLEETRIYNVDGSIDYSFEELNKTKKVLFLPYHAKAKEINVYEEGELRLTISVGKFSKEVPEKTEEQLEEEKKFREEKELKKVEEEVKKVPIWKWVLVGLGLLIVIIVAGILLSLRRRKRF